MMASLLSSSISFPLGNSCREGEETGPGQILHWGICDKEILRLGGDPHSSAQSLKAPALSL